MREIDDLTKTVAFVCVRVNETLRPLGTAFFICHIEKFHPQMYVVTAKHVIDGIRNRYACSSVFLTYNGKFGRQHSEVDMSNWYFHPEPREEYVDVAVSRFNFDFSLMESNIPNAHHVRYWSDASIYGHSGNLIPNFEPPKVRVGDEVLIAGLFVHNSGTNSNIPILRTGNLAAIPPEPVQTRLGPMRALLVEIRSIGGLSGSPVIAQPEGGLPTILGLVNGHFDQTDASSIDVEDDSSQTAKINAGIAIVVPANLIRETIAPLIYEDFHNMNLPLP